MVGVAGKYKGCNTCRVRRIKCDNARPYCRKCLDSGRECAGYERERVFIIGTPREQGRCSSHPRRAVSGRGSRKAPTPSGSDRPGSEEPVVPKHEEAPETPRASGTGDFNIVSIEPLRPAWDDLVSVFCSGAISSLQIASLNTDLSMVTRSERVSNDTKLKTVSLPPYILPDARRSMENNDFELRSQCLMHISDVEEVRDEISGTVTSTDSICLFLFERNWSNLPPSLPPWIQNASLSSSVKQLGPENFKTFPAHHFFARVYRPNALFAAVINRKSTFLASPEWTSVPWELHPKSAIDKLLDIIALIPALLSRADHILPHIPATLERRMLAHDLVGNCLNVQGLLDGWLLSLDHDLATDGAPVPQQLYWVNPLDESASIPFTDSTYGFRDLQTATGLIYYWTALLILLPCIEHLNQAVYEPVAESFPQLFPAEFYNMTQADSLPMHLVNTPFLGSSVSVPGGRGGGGSSGGGKNNTQELAASICRSLDFALARSVQPDLLAVPLSVVEEHYREVNMATGDATMELMWCEAFSERLSAKGQGIADVVQRRSWRELRRFGP